MSSLVVYITAHGLGHAGRTCDVLSALRELEPELPITVVSRLPGWFLASRLPGVPVRELSLDVGMVQRDAVQVDLAATLQQVRSLNGDWESLLKQERSWLRGINAKLVVADIPALPLEAASLEGIPTVALGNFSWDWIYQSFQGQDPAWSQMVERCQGAYASCDRLLRYPFHAPMEAFSVVEDIPLVARPGENRREQLSQRFQLDPGLPWVLFVFAQLDFSSAGVERLKQIGGVQLLTTGCLNWEGPGTRSLPGGELRFCDLVASVDAVLTKPGFGILSDCVTNGTPLLYVERENFREAQIMEQATQDYTSHLRIDLADLYEGRLNQAFEQLGQLRRPAKELAVNGASAVAQRLLELISRRSTLNSTPRSAAPPL